MSIQTPSTLEIEQDAAKEHFAETFTVTEPAQLTAHNIRGTIDIKTGESGTISVTAIRHAKTGNAKRTKIKMSQDDDGHVKVTTRCAERKALFFSLSETACKVDYTITVPPTCSVTVNSVANSTSIQGVSGDIHAKSVSGDVSLADLTGTLQVNVVSGSVTGHRLTGPLSIKTVSGHAVLRESNAESIIANTVSGDLGVESPLGTGPYNFSSVSGNITLHVTENARGTVTLSTLSGRLKAPDSITHRHTTRGVQRIEFSPDGPDIRASSVSGNLHIRAAGVVPAPVAKTIDPQKRHFILEQIANGELSVAEGIKELA